MRPCAGLSVRAPSHATVCTPPRISEDSKPGTPLVSVQVAGIDHLRDSRNKLDKVVQKKLKQSTELPAQLGGSSHCVGGEEPLFAGS